MKAAELTEVERVDTPTDTREMASHFAVAVQRPELEGKRRAAWRLAMILLHVETAGGAAIDNHNPGFLAVGSGRVYDDAWQREYFARPYRSAANQPARFRAYRDALSGALDFCGFLATFHGPAIAQLEASEPNVSGAVDALLQRRYFVPDADAEQAPQLARYRSAFARGWTETAKVEADMSAAWWDGDAAEEPPPEDAAGLVGLAVAVGTALLVWAARQRRKGKR